MNLNQIEQHVLAALAKPEHQRGLAAAIASLVPMYEAIEAAEKDEIVEASKGFARAAQALTDVALDIASSGLSTPLHSLKAA